ncbi:MAG: hypothetical protein ACRD2W_24240 [Acidimicrobiales bacterium]
MGSRVTWRLVVPAKWGRRGDPSWLPAVGADAWRKLFASEDMAGQVLRDQGRSLPWRVASEASSLLASVLGHYRVQLRVAEDVAAGCERSGQHLAALAAASAGCEAPTRTHPPGPWRVSARLDGTVGPVAGHPSVDGAEGDAAARRAGAPSLVCWAEPGLSDVDPAAAAVPGWEPRVERETRWAAFAVEEAVAALCAAPGLGLTGPDVLDVRLLCMLGDASWRCIHEYRNLMAAVWTDLERCPFTARHEDEAAAAIEASNQAGAATGPLRWRHVVLAGDRPTELSVHDTWRHAAASVAVARATDDAGIYWAEPVLA